MKREDLKTWGVPDEAVDKIMAENGRDIEAHKTAAETAQTQIAGLTGQLTAANGTIEGFKKLDVEGIKKAAKDWEEKYATDTAALTGKLKAQSRDAAIKLAVAKEKVHDEGLTVAALDSAKITVAEDGTITGLTEQMTELRKSKPFLFKTGERQQNYTPNGGDLPLSDMDKLSDADWFAAHQKK